MDKIEAAVKAVSVAYMRIAMEGHDPLMDTPHLHDVAHKALGAPKDTSYVQITEAGIALAEQMIKEGTEYVDQAYDFEGVDTEVVAEMMEDKGKLDGDDEHVWETLVGMAERISEEYTSQQGWQVERGLY